MDHAQAALARGQTHHGGGRKQGGDELGRGEGGAGLVRAVPGFGAPLES